MWRKHTRRIKSSRLLFALSLATVLSTTGLWGLVGPQKASAASSDFSPTQRAAAWSAAIALSNCSNSVGWDGTQTGGDINAGGIFNRIDDLSPSSYKAVGYLIDLEDGEVGCFENADVLQLFNAVGETPLNFLTDNGIYKINGAKTAYDFSLSSDAAAGNAIKAGVAKKFGLNFNAGMPQDLQYAALLAAFNSVCKASEGNGGLAVSIVDAQGNVQTKNFTLNTEAGEVNVGYSLPTMACASIITEMNKTSNAYSATIKANLADDNAGNDNNGAGGATGLGEENAKCETSGNPATWFMCPIFNGVAEFSDWMFRNLVEPLLKTPPISTDSNNGSFKIWSNFRLYGNILLVIFMLVIVFGQAIGGGLIDAYTAKKVMPRILVAAILVNLSIYIVAALVDITNILGGGIGKLMTAPLGDAAQFKFSPNGSQSLIISGGSIVAFLGTLIFSGAGGILAGSAGSFLALFVILPAFVGILGAFLTMVIRQGIILTLILVSPAAFALYCLPNTEKYFKKWWEALVKTLLVYPIVIVMFAVADILAVTIQSANGFGSGPLLTQVPANAIAGIVAFVAQFLPLVLIPWSFKMAGGLVGSLIGTLSSLGKKGVEGIKGNANDPNSLRNKVKRNLGEQMTNSQYNAIRRGDSYKATKWQERRARAIKTFGGNVNARQARYTALAQEREEMESKTGYDGYRYAANYFDYAEGQALDEGLTDFDGSKITAGTLGVAREGDGGRLYFDNKGRRITKQMALTSAARHASSVHDAGRNQEYAVRKIQTDADVANARRGFAATAVRNGWSDTDIKDGWARSYFEHKDKFSSEWFSTPEAVTDASGRTVGVKWNDVAEPDKKGLFKNQDKQASEIHKARQSFQLGSIRAVDFKSWDKRRNAIQAQFDAGKAGAVSEEDLKFFAETNEILDGLVSTGQIQFNPDGEPQVMGSTAEAQGVVKALFKNKRYDTQAAQNPDGTYNLSVRDIVKRPPPGTAGPTLRVAQTQVTGDADRAVIPRQA